MMPVPAQQSAVDYLNQTAKGFFRKYWLGGHSKGGNLAIYSGVYSQPKVQKKIVKINSFDGPGFNRKVVDDPAYKMVADRIDAFVPVSSIVGMLMEHEEDYKVVDSSEFSIMQHEGFSWKVKRDGFVLVDDIDNFSRTLSTSVKMWLTKVGEADRKEIVDAMFAVFEEAGIVDFMELANLDVRKAGALLKASAKVQHKQRELVVRLIKLFIEESTKK